MELARPLMTQICCTLGFRKSNSPIEGVNANVTFHARLCVPLGLIKKKNNEYVVEGTSSTVVIFSAFTDAVFKAYDSTI